MKKLLFTLLALLLFSCTCAAGITYSDSLRQKAESGDAEAQCSLGACFQFGQGIDQNYAKAVEWYTKAAQQNNMVAQFFLGDCYEKGQGVAQDYSQAVYLYNKAAQQGLAYAQCSLGLCYYNGYGVTQDYSQTIYWFNKAAQQGDAMAQFYLGVCHENGDGVPKDYSQAVEWYTKAAQQGNAEGQLGLGQCYYNGNGVAKDYSQAVEWYTKAAQQGLDFAQFFLGNCYENGCGVDKDYSQAVYWFTKAAQQGNAQAQCNLGYGYEKGYGVAKDYNQAVYWYTKAAQQGDAQAQCNLGYEYEKGYGVAKDYNQAVYWYTKAAQQGNAQSQCNLGECYFYGNGVIKDYNKAVELYNKATQQGNANAQYDLGVCYENGQGVVQDYLIALEWYKKAADSGYEDAKAKCNDTNFLNLVEQSRQGNNQNGNQSSITKNLQKSSVDINIPVTSTVNDNSFAVIVANEKYHQEPKVPFAINDGNTFAQYCKETLGIPEKNVHCINDASLNDIRHEVSWLKDVMVAYNGEAKVIFYYAGHGIPDENHQTAYLLPVDGYGNDATTGYCLDDLYSTLGSAPAKDVVVLLDACFSGAKRDGGMLASARGVAIKVKDAAPQGNMLVFTAAQGDETAFPYKEQSHGLFTYYLLKGLQDTKGNTSLKQLVDYVTTNVRRQSIVINGKNQTPTANVSPALSSTWQKLTLK